MDNNFYVDDLLKSVDTEIHALTLHMGWRHYVQLEVLASIQQPEKAKQLKNLELDIEYLPVTWALWSPMMCWRGQCQVSGIHKGKTMHQARNSVHG